MAMTGSFTHPSCRKRDMMAGHLACPQRLDAVVDRLSISGLDVALQRRLATPAAVADLELAHSKMYAASLRGLHDELADDARAGGPWHVQIDPDTAMGQYTWEAHLMPWLDAFAPEMIFISAGFDAHRDDDMAQLGLLEQDYAQITRRIMEVADRHAQGRVVSCLEGGYVMGPLSRSVEAPIRAMADV
jgi:acetoin utilization deacetylase AcuC-like enzyme